MFWNELLIFHQIIRLELQLTFANKMSFWIHEANLFSDFINF